MASGAKTKLYPPRIYCGDALDVLPTLPLESVDLCVAQPPYYVRSGTRMPEVWGMERTIDDYAHRIYSVIDQIYRVLRPDGVLWLVISAEDSLFLFGLWIQTKRPWSQMGLHLWIDRRSRFLNKNHILVFFKDFHQNFKGITIRASSTKAISFTEPGTGKRVGYRAFPLRIPRAAILSHCPEGGVVLDPFMGQGTTIQVAHRMGCRAIGIEISRELCDLSSEDTKT